MGSCLYLATFLLSHTTSFRFFEVKFKVKYSPILGMTLKDLQGFIQKFLRRLFEHSQLLFEHYMYALFLKGWVN